MIAQNRVTTVPDTVPLRNALVSVADKTGIETFLAALWRRSPSLNVYSTGGTFDRCVAAGESEIELTYPEYPPLSWEAED